MFSAASGLEKCPALSPHFLEFFRMVYQVKNYALKNMRQKIFFLNDDGGAGFGIFVSIHLLVIFGGFRQRYENGWFSQSGDFKNGAGARARHYQIGGGHGRFHVLFQVWNRAV